MVIFSPWAFGTTQRWSIWVMNGMGYALGVLWIIGSIIRHWKSSYPPTWNEDDRSSRSSFFLEKTLAALTIGILGYCFISALNARATYLHAEGRFEYHDCLTWLPHSLDGRSTWMAFW